MTAQQHQPAIIRESAPPVLSTRKEKWILIAFISLYIPFFLLFFQPFGVNNYDPSHRVSGVFLLAASLFGIVSGLTLSVYEFWMVPRLFRSANRFYLAIRLSVGMLLLSITIFLLYNTLGGFHDWSWRSFRGFVGNVFIMGLIPFSMIILFLEYQKIKRAFARTDRPRITNRQALLRLTSDNGREYLSLTPDHLLFIEAQGNYVFIYHLENEGVRKSLLRTTMKKLERHLRPYGVIRCHRSFLVNVSRIAKAVGSGQQLQLHLENYPENIPVSRSYISAFKQQLTIYPI